MKAILIEPNKNPKLIDYNDLTRVEIFGNECTDHFSMCGAEHEGMQLCSIVFDRAPNTYNKYGSIFANYLRDPYWIRTQGIAGPVVIIDDNGDIDNTKYEILRNIINSKKNKKIPQKLLDHCNNTLNNIHNSDTTDSFFISIMKYNEDDILKGIKNYGNYRKP